MAKVKFGEIKTNNLMIVMPRFIRGILVFGKKNFQINKMHLYLQSGSFYYGGLAQLARALAWHARGHRFESGILHKMVQLHIEPFFL